MLVGVQELPSFVDRTLQVESARLESLVELGGEVGAEVLRHCQLHRYNRNARRLHDSLSESCKSGRDAAAMASPKEDEAHLRHSQPALELFSVQPG